MFSSTMPQAVADEHGYYAVGGCGGNIAWHTVDDTLEIADRDNLERDIKVYGGIVWRLANAPVLPFDLAAAGKDIKESLNHYHQALGDRSDLGEVGAVTERLHRGSFGIHGESERERSRCSERDEHAFAPCEPGTDGPELRAARLVSAGTRARCPGSTGPRGGYLRFHRIAGGEPRGVGTARSGTGIGDDLTPGPFPRRGGANPHRDAPGLPTSLLAGATTDMNLFSRAVV